MLLIDEADVYLSQRNPFVTNALIGVFLTRMVEYRGLLILTTNRYAAFDNAVVDRIDLAIEYPELQAEDRTKLWRKVLSQRCPKLNTEANIKSLANVKRNGRQVIPILPSKRCGLGS